MPEPEGTQMDAHGQPDRLHDREADTAEGAGMPKGFRSHYLPRTRNGWIAVVSFFLLFALVEPPFTHGLANRVEPWVLGFPFLYTYLLVLYSLIICVLIWAQRRRL